MTDLLFLVDFLPGTFIGGMGWFVHMVLMLLMAVCAFTSAEDIITTIAGKGTGSYSGDNGAAISATLYYPDGVALDASGRQFFLYVCRLICKFLIYSTNIPI